MGYKAYGTDISERMIDYSDKNLKHFKFDNYYVETGDATNYKWSKAIDAVACEGYLGKPFSRIPNDIELKEQKQECGSIVLGFLKNLSGQIKKDTPVVIAVPAWLRSNDSYERLDILDEIETMGYNVNNRSREGLLYHRPEQIVARDIIILRKK
jgi:tRNA G10  N-methylase Trm11